MAGSIRIGSTAPSRVRGGKDDRFEPGSRGGSQIRIRCAEGAELSDAELEQVTAAGGIRIGTDGANN